MNNNTWLTHRNRGLHMTIRDVDCRDFDVPRFIRDLQAMHVTFFSFFVGGYVTTYPTRLEFQRMSPYLNGRDLAGEIFSAAREAGIKTLAMIDTGQLPAHAAKAHPEWAVQDSAGQPVKASGLADGDNRSVYLACPLGGYQRDYLRLMVAEILERYQPDCMKFGGSSFGFPRRICYCPNCRAQFRADSGLELPREDDPTDSAWAVYSTWRLSQTRRRARELNEIVKAVDPHMPVMGNGVGFGDPGWTLGAGLDIEHIAAQHDAVQLEIQTRARYDPANGSAEWQWLSWPAETARHMTTVSDRPIWIVASYFLAWPWRRSAMPGAEQKVYLAQVAANGADPMVNLSGGPPAAHEDPRGFQAIRELYGFLAKHQAYYEGDRSGSEVALLYSLACLQRAADQGQAQDYLAGLRGWQQALHDAHIPFDILSTESLHAGRLAPYHTLVLPGLTHLTVEQAQILRDYAGRGGGLVADQQVGRFDLAGQPHPQPLLADLFGVAFTGDVYPAIQGDEPGYSQAYLKIAGDHPLLDGIEGTSLIAAGGQVTPVSAAAGTVVALTLSATFIVFPEGFSYPRQPDSGAPMLVCREQGGGRAVYFAGTVAALYYQLHIPDYGRLLANAVLWAANHPAPVVVQAPPGLQISLRKQDDARLVHLINLAGTRYFDRPIPLHDIQVTLPAEPGCRLSRAFLLSGGQVQTLADAHGIWKAQVRSLNDYDVLVFAFTREE